MKIGNKVWVLTDGKIREARLVRIMTNENASGKVTEYEVRYIAYDADEKEIDWQPEPGQSFPASHVLAESVGATKQELIDKL